MGTDGPWCVGEVLIDSSALFKDNRFVVDFNRDEALIGR